MNQFPFSFYSFFYYCSFFFTVYSLLVLNIGEYIFVSLIWLHGNCDMMKMTICIEWLDSMRRTCYYCNRMQSWLSSSSRKLEHPKACLSWLLLIVMTNMTVYASMVDGVCVCAVSWLRYVSYSMLRSLV